MHTYWVGAAAFLLLYIPLRSRGQTANPAVPSKEHVRSVGQVIAIENTNSGAKSGGCQISASAEGFNASGGKDTISVVAGAACASWSAISSQSWIAITADGSGSGNGTVSFTVSANSGSSARSGVITIAGLTFTIEQQGSISSAQSMSSPADAQNLSLNSVAPRAVSRTSSATTKPKGIFELFGVHVNAVNKATASPIAGPKSVTPAPSAGPSRFTAYLAPYGSVFQAISGSSSTTVLPLRVHSPAGASQLSDVSLNLKATRSGKTEYTVFVENDGHGGFSLRGYTGDLEVVAPPPPYLEILPLGINVRLATPITVGSLSISAYKFALKGSEFQLDLTVKRTDKFDDQIVVYGVAGDTFSDATPGTAMAQWRSQ